MINSKDLLLELPGVVSPRAINAPKRFITLENSQIMFLLETKLKDRELENIRKKVRMDNMVGVSCLGEGRKRKDSLSLMWKEGVQVDLRAYSLNHLMP